MSEINLVSVSKKLYASPQAEIITTDEKDVISTSDVIGDNVGGPWDSQTVKVLPDYHADSYGT